jgi:transcriptional regulator with XRE-family HTH domain
VHPEVAGGEPLHAALDRMPRSIETTAHRVAERLARGIGTDIARLREDAGLTRAALATAAGIDAAFLGRIERGEARASTITLARISVALGADLSLRLYPNTGPAVRDRHQAPMIEAVLGVLHPRWRAYPEVVVRSPVRGSIDLGLHYSAARLFVATESQSELGRLEQIFRWSSEKADALPSWTGWSGLGQPPVVVSRLLIVRDTRATRAVAHEFRRTLAAAYPGDSEDALAALTDGAMWPGPAVLWAVREGAAGAGYRIAARR